MRGLIKIVGGLLLLCVAGLIALPFVIPVDSLKTKVLAQIEQQTGRKISIDKISFSVFPNIAFKAQNVSVGNPSWAQGNMAEIKELRIGVALLPLLHKEVEVTELTLDEPHFMLLKHGDQANWQFSTSSTQPAASAAAPQKPASGNTGSSQIALLSAEVNIKDGLLIYKDMNSGATEQLSDIDITLKGSQGDEKVTLKGSSTYKDKKADIDLTLTHPFAITAGKPADGELKCSYGSFDFAWQGTLALGATPMFTGKFTVPVIDLSAPAEHTQSQANAPASAKAAAPSQGGGHWSDAPISLDALNRVNANLTLSIGKLLLRKNSIKDINAALHITSGTLSLSTSDISAYSGIVKMGINATSTNAINITMNVTGVEAQPLLTDFADMSNLSGTMDGVIRIVTHGTSQRAMVEALNGDGAFRFKNGVWKGRNILSMAQGLGSAFSGGDETTKFSELSGSFTIKDGVVSNKDLKLTSPVLGSGGEGTADLPRWQVNYLLKPVLASAVSVPIRIEGPLDSPSYKPDMKAALQENLGDPSKLTGNAKQLKQNLGGALQGILR